jgi:hypothetical protein
MKHAISMTHLRQDILRRHESQLYAVAKPEQDPVSSAQRRSTRSRMEDYAERRWQRLDNTFLE